MNLPPTSLRGRLVLGAVTVGLTFALVFGLAATWRVHQSEDRAVHTALLSRIDLARDEVGRDGTLSQDAGSPKTDLVQVIGPDGRVRSSSAALSGVPALADVSAVRRSLTGLDTGMALRSPDVDLSVRAVPLPMSAKGQSPGGTGALIAAVDTEGFNAVTSDLLGLLVVGLVAVVLAVAALSWVLTGRALRSVTRLTETAENVGPRDLATGLPVPARDVELTRLVAALNRMLVRLHEGHATELAFAADAGHRLRTPVATLRAEAELALQEPDPREQSAALERIVRDADQLASIIDRMLVRNRARDYAPEGVVTALAAATPRWQRQAELAGVRLRADTVDTVSQVARCAAFAESTQPVVDNAIRHTPQGGLVTVVVRQEAGTDVVIADVSNDGPPVSPEVVPHLFDAWVSTRDASVAGGLGLWLAREVARESGGDVTLLDRKAEKTTFRIVLPVVTAPG